MTLESQGSSKNLEDVFLFSSIANLPTSSEDTATVLDSELVSSETAAFASAAQPLCLVSAGEALVEEAESDIAEGPNVSEDQKGSKVLAD